LPADEPRVMLASVILRGAILLHRKLHAYIRVGEILSLRPVDGITPRKMSARVTLQKQSRKTSRR